MAQLCRGHGSGIVVAPQRAPLVARSYPHIAARPCIHQQAVNSKAAEALRVLKPSGPKAVVDPVYTAASNYLQTQGIVSLAEINRVLDIAMNPSSLFLAQSKNANARPLDVEKDIRPVFDFLHEKQISGGDIVKIVCGHPPVLSYSIEQLEKLWQYLASIGINDVADVIIKRPNLLGLDVDKNLRKIVEYLQYVETPPETIVKYLTESI